MKICHGCMYLEGKITNTVFFAECSENVWKGNRTILLGEEINRPKKCTEKILRKDAEKCLK